MSAALPRELLARRALRPKKSWGQNFLGNAELATRIAELATTPPGGTVVEIGAGLGALTAPLLARASRVVAIERDRDLARVLREEFAAPLASGQLVLEEADAKTVDYRALLSPGPRPHVVAGNLPFQLTGVLLERVTSVSAFIDRAVVLVQLEVAERLTALPGTPSYGALSVFIQAQFEPRRAMLVRKGAFYPQPSVDSALVVLDPRRPPVTAETPAFRALVRAAFQQRRKQLRNAWHTLFEGPAKLEAVAADCGIDLGRRGETLCVAEFARVAREIER
jgi:16S rRNA (adenine1518-N6/adenine1519-N6)-dimethyltransferase